MKIAIVSDAWIPQVNGVVRTLRTIRNLLEDIGHSVEVFGPDRFKTLPMPGYSEISVSLFPGRKLSRLLDAFHPDAIHVATEGTLGWAARSYCVRRGLPFTTSYHTRFPEYAAERMPVPLSWGYAILRMFHEPSRCTMVPTKSIADDLAKRRFSHLCIWSRGVDVNVFHPRETKLSLGEGPIMLYVGRVAVEKNITAFLDLDRPGTKVVIGDGPLRAQLSAKYPDVRFLGAKFGDDLALHFASADVFVFPSRTDTFGLVIVEALASGVPVAAYPVPGPIDIIGSAPSAAPVGALDNDLGKAVDRALTMSPVDCRDFAEFYSWERSTEQFLSHLNPYGKDDRDALSVVADTAA